MKQDGGFNSEKTVIEEVESIFIKFHIMEKEMEEILTRIENTADRNDHETGETDDGITGAGRQYGGTEGRDS